MENNKVNTIKNVTRFQETRCTDVGARLRCSHTSACEIWAGLIFSFCVSYIRVSKKTHEFAEGQKSHNEFAAAECRRLPQLTQHAQETESEIPCRLDHILYILHLRLSQFVKGMRVIPKPNVIWYESNSQVVAFISLAYSFLIFEKICNNFESWHLFIWISHCRYGIWITHSVVCEMEWRCRFFPFGFTFINFHTIRDMIHSRAKTREQWAHNHRY